MTNKIIEEKKGENWRKGYQAGFEAGKADRMYADIGGGSEEHRYTVNQQLARYQENGLWYLMQSTGLLDKNGEEIHSGDILKSQNCMYEVVWWKEKLMWANKNEIGGYAPLWSLTKDVEIIGNLYEHPDLLTKQK